VLTNSSKAISDQKILLEKSSTRKTIQRMKDDTSSLYVQRDSTSINSRVSQFTDTLSKISRSFEFDRELFSTKVYGSAFRGSLKHTVEALRRQKAQMESIIRSDSLEKEEKRRNLLIDRQLEEDQNRLRTECKVLVLGDDDCGQDFLKQTKLYQIRGLSTGRRWEYLWEYKNVIRDNVREIMKALGSIIKEANSELDEKTMDLARRMDHELTVNPNDDPVVSAAAAEALRGLWASEQISELIQSARSRLPISAE
jgi:guanine nucleotide-binding protein G(i) subunit alpha